MVNLLFKDEVYNIIGAAMDVHKELGSGFLESVYSEAFEYELEEKGIPFKKEQQIDIYYKHIKLDKKFRFDFLCYDEVVVELKAVSNLVSEHEAQLLNYLKATDKKLGLLINFGAKSLQYKRMIF